MNEFLVIGLLILAYLVGVAMTPVRLHGTWVIVARTAWYAWSEGRPPSFADRRRNPTKPWP